MQVLVLETTGRTSGRPRSVGLFFLERDGRYHVVGSFAGEDRDPAWVRNVRAHPRATVTLGGRTIPVIAHPLEGAERADMFERFVRADGSYAVYRDRTTREIPVIELRPEG
jgi:deazaflavin-dependent oxidoreductase (nitroreductase family)